MYEDITTPEELLEWMKYINYGYLGKTKLHHTDEPDFDEVWYEEYILQEPQKLIETKLGNCWDQTELERWWFENHNYEIKTFYEMINLPYENDYPTHSFLVYKDKDNSWNWFENSDFENRGIHKFSDLTSLVDYQISKYKELLNTKNIKEDELKSLILKEFDKPHSNISAKEYIDHVLSGKDYKEV